ncbi:hypothetical protein ACFVRU_56700 [Streptomyces sp. NPDC057927]
MTISKFSVVKRERELFNENIKEQFLTEQYENEESRNIVRYTFFNASPLEFTKNKDLYDFTKDEVIELIYNSSPKSAQVASNISSLVRTYHKWANEKYLRESNLAVLDVEDLSFYDRFVDHSLKQFISKNEMLDMMSKLVNTHDRALLYLLFTGVYGYQLSEIRNLTIDDVNLETCELTLTDDKKGQRKIVVDKDLIELLVETDNDLLYLTNNGVSFNKKVKERQLQESKYIIKPAITLHNRSDAKCSQPTIINRIDGIREFFDLPNLKPKTINRSGMLYMANNFRLQRENDELTKDDYEEIGDRYNWSKHKNGKSETYNYTHYVNSFLNDRNMDELYGTIESQRHSD